MKLKKTQRIYAIFGGYSMGADVLFEKYLEDDAVEVENESGGFGIIDRKNVFTDFEKFKKALIKEAKKRHKEELEKLSLLTKEAYQPPTL